MNFEKKMKKHIDQTLDEIVPNPYPTPTPKKTPFPLWAKVAIPAVSFGLAASITFAVVIPTLLGANGAKNNRKDPYGENTNTSTIDKGGVSRSPTSKNGPGGTSKAPTSEIYIPSEGLLPAAAPFVSNRIYTLDNKFVKNTAIKSIANIESVFANPLNKNTVISPASYLLCMMGLIAVSDGYNLEPFGLTDPDAELKTFLEAMNCAWSNQGKLIGSYRAGVLHQQVGNQYQFNEEKREQVADKYIATGIATPGNYRQQAKEYFEHAVDLTLDIPDLRITGSALVTYGALKMLDSFTFTTEKMDFNTGSETVNVDSAKFGDPNNVSKCPGTMYFTNDYYSTFRIRLSTTEFVVVLPQEGVSLESISVSEALANHTNNAKLRYFYGNIPYFHLRTEGLDLTRNTMNNMTGEEVMYSKLMDRGLPVSNTGLMVLQSSDFQFSENGVAGESITASSGSGAIDHPNNPVELIVDRPFYAICLRDNFPLFVNKVNDPSK